MSSNVPVMVSVNRAEDCPDISHCAHATLIYLGQRSLLCETPAGALIAITTPSRGLAPGGITVTEESFAQAAAQLGDAPRSINLAALIADFERAPAISLQMPALAIDPRVIGRAEVALAEYCNDATEEMWGHCRAIFDLDDDEGGVGVGGVGGASGEGAFTHIRALIGAGIGATPAGDDMLTGVLAALWATRALGAEASAVANAAGGAVASSAGSAGADRPASAVVPIWMINAIESLAARTTRISRMQLAAALNGSFASPHLQIVQHLSAGQVSAALECAQRIGHTSGIDFMNGFTTYPYFQSAISKEKECLRAY